MKILRWVNPFVSGKKFVVFSLCILVVISISTALFDNVSAARFTQRSLSIENSSSAGRYALSFSLSTSTNVGAIKIDATSTSLDMSETVATDQSGETGFVINQQQTAKEVVLSRKSVVAGTQINNYILDNIRNPSGLTTFSIPVLIYSNSGATGAPTQTVTATMSQISTKYTVGFAFPGTASVGSVRMEFCDDPVPYLPCTPPAGLNVVNAVFTSQTGETGFSINYQTNNDIMLSRTPANTGTQLNTYVLDNIQSPTQPGTFYIRLTSYASNNPDPELDRENYIDYGGVASAMINNIGLQTQVAPELIFCIALDIPQYNCSTTGGGNFVDFGELEPDQTYATQTQLLARTNVPTGYSISIHGAGVTSGNKNIPSLTVPTLSATGNSQFGINLVSNTNPGIGANQDGPGISALINPDYEITDHYVFRSGDILLSTNNVSDFKRYTVTNVLNRSPSQLPGIYATTLTYVCSVNF